MASFSDLTEPYEVCVWVRDDKNKTWIKTVVYPKVNSAENSYIRHMNLYEDKVTGIQHIFAAGVSAVVRGAYNPSLPGKLEWQGIEITGPQRMLSSAVCNGDYYIAFATDGNPTNNYGGLFRRNDGANPTWTSVWEWADTGNTDLGKNCRGLTAVNDPKGGSHQVMVGVIENLRSSYQIDPVNNTQKIEVDWQKFFEDEWGKQITAFNYAAYNNMVEIISPDKGDTCLIAGAWVTYPAAYGTPERNNSWYLVRRPNGIWHYGQVIDSLNIIPSGNGLAATRTIIKSPFTDEPNTYYFGGKDAGGTNPIFHNTAWIYKGVLRKGTTDISEESYEPKRGILISPNPASDYIEINLDKVILSEAKNPLKIYNTLGECVIEMQDVRHLRDVGHLNRINISHLPAGLYFIQFGNYSQKFMVVR
jgi:hypothetical protein